MRRLRRSGARATILATSVVLLMAPVASQAEALQIDPPWNATGPNSGKVGATGVTATSAGDRWGGAFNDDSAVYSEAALFGELALPAGTTGDAFNLAYAQAPGGPVDLVTITLDGPLQDPVFYIWDIDNIDANVTVSPGGTLFTSNARHSGTATR